MRADLTFGRAKHLRPAFTTASASENAARFVHAMMFSGRLALNRQNVVHLSGQLSNLRHELRSLLEAL
jgi:hypothetical protein